MTTDLTKTFFDTFGIEPFIYCSKPKLDCDARSKGFCRKDCEYYSGVLYPQITDHHYLLMLAYLTCCDDKEYGTNETRLKEKILEDMIQEQRLDKLAFEKGWESFDGFKTKDFVQALFKE